jgi:hypothetical protein
MTCLNDVRTCPRAVAAEGRAAALTASPLHWQAQTLQQPRPANKASAKQPSVRGHIRFGVAAFARHSCHNLVAVLVGICLSSYVFKFARC